MDVKKMNKILEAACTTDPKDLERLEALAKSLRPQLSDLEIVQKALKQSDAVLNMYADGSSSAYTNTSKDFEEINTVDFPDGESLLTCAKQTIGDNHE